jgi:hypothetical protein
VLDIDRVGARWFIVAARFAPQLPRPDRIVQVSLYEANQELLSIKLLHQVSPATEIIAWQRAPMVGEVGGDSYFVMMGSDLYRLDLSTGAWSQLTKGMTGFHISEGARVITAYRSAGVWSKVFFSRDMGQSWQELASAPSYIIRDVLLESPEGGAAVRWRMDAFSGALEYLSYNSVQKRWDKVAEAPPGCVGLLRNGEKAAAFCTTAGGSILSLKKEGQWVVEFSAD